MHSKWLDLATEIAAFHYQSRRYDAFKPPAFGANPEVQNLDVRESDISRLTNSGLHMSTVNQRGSDPHMSFDDTLPSVSVSEKESLPTALPLQKKYNRQNISRNGLIRHAKSPTMMDLMQEMDDMEVKKLRPKGHG
ncbi:unnamed protein product [Pseudo-nitzschia multistriata]|uniref:Uncharacterized protein n=1 Tax=Pseudo-nitzschia multistriata TaxID=183589 RepID=A0A448YX28_9STRA|nr:unnamed protein product [Pseudo-nitzschia multistriata]